MQRFLIDTHIFIWYAKERDRLSRDVLAILEDYDKKHYDPSDHLIISHALCNGIPLISDDDKFPFYRAQGLELIEN